MDIKKFLIAAVAAFVVIFVGDFIVHGFLLKEAYESTASVWRPEADMMAKQWLMMLGQAFWALALAFVYAKCCAEGSNKGLSFGFFTGLILIAEKSFVWYVVLAVPFSLNLAWLASTMVNSLLAGLAIGAVYAKRK